MEKPTTLCDRCEKQFSCLLNYDGVPCRKNRTVEPTNYDRIISKTPENLATLISENIDCGVCENVFGLRPCSERCCPDFWLDWLRQEALS